MAAMTLFRQNSAATWCMHSSMQQHLQFLMHSIYLLRSVPGHDYRKYWYLYRLYVAQPTVSMPVFFKSGSAEVTPVVSKGSAAGPQVLSKKIKLRPTFAVIDAFSRLLLGPKCICGRGSAPKPTA